MDRSQSGVVVNGVPWFDDRGEPVNAHGCCVVEHEGTFYLFGEHKGDDVNEFSGFSCYVSTDLATWTWQGMALPVQADGLLGPNRVGERPKVMRCPATGLFVMYAHADDLTYTDPQVALAVSDTPAGPYRVLGVIEHDGEPLRRWDIGAFQDLDGTGYLLVHEGDIYRLSDDYLGVVERVAEGIAPGGESPAMLVDGGTYYAMYSRKTSWERNDNYYLAAPTVAGPWTHRGPLAPEGTLTHNSQCGFVLRLSVGGDVRHVYMGDRWSFPHQGSAASYVWLPLDMTADGEPPLVRYLPAWRPLTGESVDLDGDRIDHAFRSDLPGEQTEVAFTGRRVALLGRAHAGGGYARVEVLPASGSEPLTSSLVDFYAKVPDDGVRYLSPVLPDGDHRLRVTVTGTVPQWTDKTRTIYGSTGAEVSVSAVLVLG